MDNSEKKIPITPEQLRLVLLSVELIVVLMGAFTYWYDPNFFGRYFPFIIVMNLLSLLPFPGILKKMKNPHQESDSKMYSIDADNIEQFEWGIWEKTCTGYYIVVNIAMMSLVFWAIF